MQPLLFKHANLIILLIYRKIFEIKHNKNIHIHMFSLKC
jgi:hypothetical protein